MRIHDLRHTFTSTLIAPGHNPRYIQRQMAHSSIQVTMDLYGHLMEEVHEGAAERSEALVSRYDSATVEKKGGYSMCRNPLKRFGSGG